MKKKQKIKEEEAKINKHLLWLLERRKNFFSIILIIICLSLVSYKVLSIVGKKRPNNNEVILSYEIFNAWKNSSYKDDQKILELKTVLKKYPDLKPKYEGIILQQAIFNEGLTKDITKMATESLGRIKQEFPLYHLYSTSALHIANKEYEKALKAAKELKETMLNDLSFLQEKTLPAGAVLYSLNLLRIAHLEGVLKNEKEEIKNLEELATYLGLNKKENVNQNIQKAARFIKESFSEKNIELRDYIQYKKNLISSK